MQERTRRRFDEDFIANLTHIELIEGAEWRTGLTGGGAKCCEVMATDQKLLTAEEFARIVTYPTHGG